MIAAIVLAQTESRAFAPLIPVIAALVGGVLTAGGGFLANYFQLSTSREMERRQFYRERLEQIYLWVNQVVDWMDREWELWELQHEGMVSADRILEFRDANVVENPISRLRLSADFYFPELTSEVIKMVNCVESFSASLESNEPEEATEQYRSAQDFRTHFLNSIKPLVSRYL